MGDILVRLYDETPLHRDNFLKLAGEGFFDGTLFHRVIKDFMIQGGDPDSKGAPAGKSLGTGGPGYTVKAEFVYPQLFHKRGALSAARLGDEMNPERESSGSQFYIVTGEEITDETLQLYAANGFTFSEEAIAQLQQLPWPGNIRELRNIVERLIILCGDTITADDVKEYA